MMCIWGNGTGTTEADAFNLVLRPWCVFEAMELEPLKQMHLVQNDILL